MQCSLVCCCVHFYVAVFDVSTSHCLVLLKISINVWGLHGKVLILVGYSGGSHEKRLEPTPMSDISSSSQLQNRSTSGQS